MAISYQGGNSAVATSVTIPTHAVGDLILIWAFARNSTTLPTAPAAGGTVPTWSTAVSGGTTGTCAGRLFQVVATATNHTSGTFTGASGMIAVVLRGQKSSGYVGGTNNASTTTLDATLPAVTLSVSDGSSMVLKFAGARSGAAAATWGSAPGGYTQRIADGSAWSCLDTLDVTTSDSSATQTRTNATVGTSAVAIEIIAEPAAQQGNFFPLIMA